ncbi:MAG: glycosyltransferase family 39 protein [Planctomyces sp.]|nr:glycosyltransferase family 39 protein [Planctomyces sp.]
MKLRRAILELVAVLIVLAIGVGLRVAWPSRMAVEHFDEGVYASNLYSPLTGDRYPDQHLYAPPLLPWLLEWSTVFFGPGGAMWVNVFAGSVTLAVVWGLVRSWWGPAAAGAALVLLAFNEFHVAYSRAALTDALLCLWLTAGVWTGWRAVVRGGWGNLLIAGGFAALAWWTKYNGWLTLAITGAGTGGWLVAERWLRPGPRSAALAESSPEAGRVLFRWLATAAIAFAAWSPWLIRLQDHGGYAAVARNHAGYFSGPGEWGANAARQLGALLLQLGWSGSLLLPLATLAAAALLAAGLAGAAGTRGAEPAARDDRGARSAAVWFSLAWLIGLSVAVPLYRPYPRLMLPWVVAGAVAGGGLVAAVVTRRGRRSVVGSGGSNPASDAERPSSAGRLETGLVAAGLALCAVVGVWRPTSATGRADGIGRTPTAWQDRTSLQRVADEALARLADEPLAGTFEGYRAAVYVVAEPGLYFHLASKERDSSVGHLTQAASDFGMAEPGGHRAPIPAYVLAGPHADHAEAERFQATGALELLAEFEDRPSDLVLLDDRPAAEVARGAGGVQRIRLFHVKATGR